MLYADARVTLCVVKSFEYVTKGDLNGALYKTAVITKVPWLKLNYISQLFCRVFPINTKRNVTNVTLSGRGFA